MPRAFRAPVDPKITARIKVLAADRSRTVAQVRDQVAAEFGVSLSMSTVQRAKGYSAPRDATLDPADQVGSFEELLAISGSSDHSDRLLRDLPGIEARIAIEREAKAKRERERAFSWREQDRIAGHQTESRAESRGRGLAARIGGHGFGYESSSHEMRSFCGDL